MISNYKYFLIIFSIVFLYFLSTSFCFAVRLEVDYPTLPTGETVTKTTPLTDYLKYVFDFGILIGFLAVFVSLIIAGIFYLVSPASPEARAKANDRLFGAISGLILLICLYLIVTTINPELSIFKITPLEETPGLYIIDTQNKKRGVGLIGIQDVSRIKPPYVDFEFNKIEYKCSTGPTLIVYFYNQPKRVDLYKKVEIDCNGELSIEGQSFNFRYKTAGVSLYKKSSCDVSGSPPAYHLTSIPDLGELKNTINSVKIAHLDPNYYIAVLYDLINYQGKCYYVSPNSSCDNLNRPSSDPFNNMASSISVYRYDHYPQLNPDNKSVTFYRNSFLNSEGGWLKIENINTIYVGDLNELKFEGSVDSGNCNVSLEQQDCIKWDLEGKCEERKCPTLAGENISSIKIDGNYFVMLVHYDSLHDDPNGKWSYCQAFPTVDDANKEGPKQIRWEYINYPGRYPNYVLIFPVKEK